MLWIYARIGIGLLGTCSSTSLYGFMEPIDGTSEQTKLLIASICRLPILFSKMRIKRMDDMPELHFAFSELLYVSFSRITRDTHTHKHTYETV